ncbi:hypothetical protein GF360_02845 [candidate division WWE3 bacterium]|nr:hypothetical protein [candidate division WWE3 bacterium]
MTLLRNLLFYISSFLISIFPMESHTEGITGQPQSFLPSQAKTQTDQTISHLIYRGLFKYDIYGILVPDLADSWDVSEDGLTYTIKLKESQTWSNGTEITSDDLIYTAFKVPDLSGVATDKVDRYTVRYTLPNKFSPFLSMLTGGVMPVDAEEKQNPLKPLSNGEFRVVRIEKEGPAVKEVVLYNHNDEADIRKLIFRFYFNEDELLTAAKLGEIDAFMHSDILDLERFENFKFPLQGVYYALFFNLRDEALQDLEFRQKLAQVLPVKKLTRDLGIPVEGPISRSIYTDKSVNFYLYEEDFVPEFVDKTVHLTIPDLKRHKVLASEIESLWEDNLGLNVVVTSKEVDELKETIEKRDFEILLYGQQVGRDPDRYVNWHSTQREPPGLNITGFEQVKADRALEEGRALNEQQERQVHYSVFQETLMENVPAVFLYHPYVNYYFDNSVSGIGEKYTFNVWDRFIDLDNWKKIPIN